MPTKRPECSGNWSVPSLCLSSHTDTRLGSRHGVTFRFDCVFCYVSDLERAIRFYAGTLGFKLTSRDRVACFEIDGVRFELVPASDSQKLEGRGNARLCLQVDDVEGALRALRTQGVATGAAEPKPGGVLGTFRDPDGNEICLWQYRDGTTRNLGT